MIKMDNFQYFSIKSHVSDVYKNRLTQAFLKANSHGIFSIYVLCAYVENISSE